MPGYTILFVLYGIMAAALIITGVVLLIDLHKHDTTRRMKMAGNKKKGGKRYGMELYLNGPGIAEMKEGLRIAEEEIAKMVAKVGCVPGTMKTAVRGELYNITIGWSFVPENEVEEDVHADD